MKNGAELIAEERQRHREEGFTPEHDAHHRNGTLAMAGACYAEDISGVLFNGPENLSDDDSSIPFDWPWEHGWWKPTPKDPIRQLAKAGALIAAEIDKLIEARNQQAK